MEQRIALCNCGQLRVHCEGAPARVSVCHCLSCKRRTGSAFSWNASFSLDKAISKGRFNAFSRKADSGRHCTYHFCPDCGSTVFYHVEGRPGLVSVPAGAFADTGFPAPTLQWFEQRRVPWCEIAIGCA